MAAHIAVRTSSRQPGRSAKYRMPTYVTASTLGWSPTPNVGSSQHEFAADTEMHAAGLRA